MSVSPYARVRAEASFATEWQARLQAMKLRRAGLSYPAISIVIEEYHGVARTAAGWRWMLRQHGAPPKPHGLAEANFR